jgi:hypothetical protein
MTAADLHTINAARRTSNDNLYFERRAADRHGVCGRATAVVSGPALGAPRNRILSLQLLNMSDSGMAGLCQETVEIGSQITVFIAPHGADRGFDLAGTVVRCQHASFGHEIGIRFRQKMAA